MRRLISYIRLAAALALALSAASCESKKPDPEFMESDNICLMINGKTVHSYNPEKCQIGFNSTSREFRVSDDKMSDFFVLTCSSIPTRSGQSISGNLRWSTGSGINTKKADFKVEKISDDNLVWLWSKKKEIGVCVKILQ